MNIEGFKNWILKNEPKEAPKVEEHTSSLQAIEKLLGKNLDDVVAGERLDSVVEKVKGLLGKLGESGETMEKVKGIGGLLGSAGSLLGDLAGQAKNLLQGKVDIAFLLKLYQRFVSSKK